ncbi:MAG: hypothetical protein JO097_03870 [Acidobacteriaceae bacterium]|nr:hypothetical protein [Acidobacteriaceae bacterium]MBV9765846.1 hypothetical protein [Acidobacteriaceae bacterium]
MTILTSRSARRLLIGVHYVGFTFFALFVSGFFSMRGNGWPAFVGDVLIFFGTGIWLLWISRNYKLDRVCLPRTTKLDERQVQVRARTLAASYFVVVGIFIALLFWTTAAKHLSFVRRPSGDDWSTIATLCLLLISFLPSAIVAWNEPDLPPSPEEPKETREQASPPLMRPFR